jgi:hypothetical protein
MRSCKLEDLRELVALVLSPASDDCICRTWKAVAWWQNANRTDIIREFSRRTEFHYCDVVFEITIIEAFVN